VKKILLAEDHEATRASLSAVLRQAGFEVEEVPSGVEAVLRLTQSRYDLLVTDLIMPEGSGFDVIQHLRKKKITIPILVCSGYVDAKGAGRSLEDFRFAAISKPLKPDDFLAAVNGLLAPASAKK
jgi:two-component system response regulator HydG